MIERMKQMVRDQRFCVLATASHNNPHCSLMAYAPEEDCCKIYMATRRDTVKYRNLMANPAVSLLIDTREEENAGERQGTRALTVTGRFMEVELDADRVKARDMLLRRHPDLTVFLDHPESCLFAVEVHSFLLLDGFTDSYYEVVSSSRDEGD